MTAAFVIGRYCQDGGTSHTTAKLNTRLLIKKMVLGGGTYTPAGHVLDISTACANRALATAAAELAIDEILTI